MELIDKSVVVEEIDRRIELFTSEKNKEGVSQIDKLSLGGRIAVLQELKVFLYTLEVKEVDLENAVCKWLDDNCDDAGYFNQLEFAKYFFELGIQQSNYNKNEEKS